MGFLSGGIDHTKVLVFNIAIGISGGMAMVGSEYSPPNIQTSPLTIR